MSRHSPVIEMLRAVPGLSTASDRSRRELASLLTESSAPPGRTLIREGARGTEVFIVVSGEAEICLGSEAVAVVGPGAFVGETALLDGGRRSATVRARTAMRLLVLGPREFRSFMSHPDGARAVALDLARRLRAGARQSSTPASLSDGTAAPTDRAVVGCAG